jgi:hypothetical protein
MRKDPNRRGRAVGGPGQGGRAGSRRTRVMEPSGTPAVRTPLRHTSAHRREPARSRARACVCCGAVAEPQGAAPGLSAQANYRGSFLPPRPEKNAVEGQRMTDAFVEERRRGRGGEASGRAEWLGPRRTPTDKRAGCGRRRRALQSGGRALRQPWRRRMRGALSQRRAAPWPPPSAPPARLALERYLHRLVRHPALAASEVRGCTGCDLRDPAPPAGPEGASPLPGRRPADLPRLLSAPPSPLLAGAAAVPHRRGRLG